MMTMDMIDERIDELESKYVIVNVMFADGSVKDWTECSSNDLYYIYKVEVVTVKEYEANGFHTEGLEGEWIEF